MPQPSQCRASVFSRYDPGARCARHAVEDGYCRQHHPLTKREKKVKAEEKWTSKRHLAHVARVTNHGLREFWASVAVCALLLFLKKHGFVLKGSEPQW